MCFLETVLGCPLSKHKKIPPGFKTLDISLKVKSKFSE